MNKCVFCKIANSDKENYRIFYSDRNYFAILVNTPETRGHFILVTKKHYSEISKLKKVNSYFQRAVSLAEEKIKLLKASAYTLKFNNNVYILEKDSRHVGHIHIHIIPKYKVAESRLAVDDNYFSEMKSLLSKT